MVILWSLTKSQDVFVCCQWERLGQILPYIVLASQLPGDHKQKPVSASTLPLQKEELVEQTNEYGTQLSNIV